MTDVAAFDFDGTLTEGGSVLEFLVALRGRRAVAAATAALAPRLAHGAVVGGATADQAKERLFVRTLAGESLTRVQEVSGRFTRHHLDRHLRPEVQQRFDWHHERGDRVIIASASPEVYVGVAGKLLGADGVVATRLAVDDHGVLSGHYQGANCRGEEKLRRLWEWIGEGPDPGRLWAYGNSRGDLRMLRAADAGFNVGRLGRFGRLRGFPGLAAGMPGGPDRPA